MSDEILENIKQRHHWLRIFFILLFLVALYVTGVIVLVVVGAQALFSVLTGRDNENLRRLGASLADYVHQVLQYITYNSSQRPFPFSPFPGRDGSGGEDDFGDPAGFRPDHAPYGGAAPDTGRPGGPASTPGPGTRDTASAAPTPGSAPSSAATSGFSDSDWHPDRFGPGRRSGPDSGKPGEGPVNPGDRNNPA